MINTRHGDQAFSPCCIPLIYMEIATAYFNLLTMYNRARARGSSKRYSTT